MLGKTFDVVTTLHHVQAADAAEVRAGDDLPVAIKIDAPSIPAAFGKNFKAAGRRVIAEDALVEFEKTRGQGSAGRGQGGRFVRALLCFSTVH